MKTLNDTSVTSPLQRTHQAQTTAAETNGGPNPVPHRVRAAVATGDYQRALDLLPTDSRHLELLNCRAVCLMRLGRFELAIGVLRSSVIHSGTLTLRPGVPDHIQINFATALFYGGIPSGGLEVLAEVRNKDHAAAEHLRQATANWVAEMSWLRRLDWIINRIEPKQLPALPTHPVGQFGWETA